MACDQSWSRHIARNPNVGGSLIDDLPYLRVSAIDSVCIIMLNELRRMKTWHWGL